MSLAVSAGTAANNGLTIFLIVGVAILVLCGSKKGPKE